jgi:deoxyribonuclease V
LGKLGGVGTQKPKALGVAKTVLVGKAQEPAPKRGSFSPIHYGGKVVGAVLRTKDNTAPIYVSPGHMISLNTALELVLKTSLYRIPEPTRLAHNLLQKVRKSV